MASGRGSMGLCSKCGQKCAGTWTASPCKHEACSKCLETAGNTATCFGCRKTVAFLFCPGRRHGCEFDTRKGSWKDHSPRCLFFPMECPNRCGMIVARKLLASHLATACQLRLTGCQFCGEAVFALEVRDHENSCPKAPVSCPYCLREGLKRGEMAQHAEGCSKTPKPCPLQEYGCDFSGVDKDIDQHLTVRNHVVCFREMKKSQREHDLQIERLKSELDSCKSELETCRNELAELSNGGGAIIFDKEILWVFQPPITPCGSLCSPLYRHRGSGEVIYFELSFPERSQGGYSHTLYRGESVAVTLDRCHMQAGRATNASTFTVIMYSLEQLEQHTKRTMMNSGTRLNSARMGENTVRSGTQHLAPIMNVKQQIVEKAGIGPCDKRLFQSYIIIGKQYVISYKQEN